MLENLCLEACTNVTLKNFKLDFDPLPYTQGIIINGAFYQQSALKNGDMIGLGEAVLTFYM